MSTTMHNGFSTWTSTSNDIVLFKGASGQWQFDHKIEVLPYFLEVTGSVNKVDCPSARQWAALLYTFPIQIESLDGLFMSFGHL